MTTSNASVSTEVLRKLHRLHRQLTDLRERLDRGPKQIRTREANVKHQEEQLAKAQADAKAFRVTTDAKQLQFKSKEDRIKDLRLKLNQAASNREYQALLDQIAAEEMANSVLADEILEALDKVDSLGKRVAEGQTTLEKAVQESERMRRDVAEREPAIRGDLERLEAELKECEANLPAEIREAYRRVVRQKGEDALAPILEGGFCGGCNQHVPLNLYSAMMLNHPIFCRACGRLLYIPEGQEKPDKDQ